MKNFIKEFREFIARGNVMDMAVGIIIGGAFTTIVNSLVNDVIMPLISILTGGISFSQWNIPLGSKDNMLNLGTFIAAVINFIIVALVIFVVIKSFNKLHELGHKEEEKTEEPTTKICPYCMSEIDIHATRCPHCTSVLEEEKKEA